MFVGRFDYIFVAVIFARGKDRHCLDMLLFILGLERCFKSLVGSKSSLAPLSALSCSQDEHSKARHKHGKRR